MPTLVPNALESVLEKLAEIEGQIEGAAEAYAYQPEAMAVFPCFINFPVRGIDTREEATTVRSMYTLGVELHVTRTILPQSERLCRPFVIRFADAIWQDPTLGGIVTTVLQVRHGLMPILFNSEVHAGIRFEIDIKMRRAVNVNS